MHRKGPHFLKHLIHHKIKLFNCEDKSSKYLRMKMSLNIVKKLELFWNLDIQGPDAKIKSLGVSTEHTFTCVRLLTRTLMEETKPEVTEKFEFEYRDNSKLMALLKTFGLSDLGHQEKKLGFFTEVFLFKKQFYRWDKNERIETCIPRKMWVGNNGKTRNYVFWYSLSLGIAKRQVPWEVFPK